MTTSVTEVPRFQIFPAIGIARVGDSLAYTYIASEAPMIDFVPPGGYRGGEEHRFPKEIDSTGPAPSVAPSASMPDLDTHRAVMADRLVKRMGCRFRIYEFDSNRIWGEVTSADADIEWRVKLVNKKAAGDADWGLGITTGPLNPEPPEDQWTEGENQWTAALTIDSEIQAVSGPGAERVELGGEIMTGTPAARFVKLGDIETDDAGRLIVYGGHGEAGSWESRPADPHSVRNSGWYDDTSDGVVMATVTIDGESFEAVEARIVVGPPDYAHPCIAPVTLFDLAFDRIGGFRVSGHVPSFKDDIYPVLHRSAFLEWTLFAIEGMRHGRTPKHGHGYTSNHDMHPDGAFLSTRVFATLHAIDSADPDYAEGQRRRDWYHRKLKIPDDPNFQFDVMGVDYNMPAINGLTFTMTQWEVFGNFAVDNFLSDWPVGRDPQDLDQPGFADISLSDRPEALNRAAMDFAVGGPFFPGVEVGAIAGEESTYFTLGLRDPRIDFRVADTVRPGDLTQSLALPWQVGFNQHNYRKQNEASADNLWPSARPVVVPAKRSGASDDMTWTRPFTDEALHLTQEGKRDIFENQKMRTNQKMIDNWSKLGFLAPATFYVEVSRTLQEDPNWPI